MRDYLEIVNTSVSFLKLLYEKIRNDTKDQEERAKEFISSLKFDRYNERSSCEVKAGISIAQFEQFVSTYGEINEFPLRVISALKDGKHCRENMVVEKEFEFAVGESGRVVYLRSVTRKGGDQDGEIDFACVMITVDFKLSKEEITTGKAYAFLKLFGLHSVTLGMRERDLTQDQKECVINYFRTKAQLALKDEVNHNRSWYQRIMECSPAMVALAVAVIAGLLILVYYMRC